VNSRKLSRGICGATLIAIALLIWSCGDAETESTPDPRADTQAEVSTELADGSYSCEATNDTRGNGPYDLECEKDGDVLTLTFPNGGHIDLDIDSQVRSGHDSWELEATHAEGGDSWTITVEQ
jgi:hypothetical protein